MYFLYIPLVHKINRFIPSVCLAAPTYSLHKKIKLVLDGAFPNTTKLNILISKFIVLENISSDIRLAILGQMEYVLMLYLYFSHFKI